MPFSACCVTAATTIEDLNIRSVSVALFYHASERAAGLPTKARPSYPVGKHERLEGARLRTANWLRSAGGNGEDVYSDASCHMEADVARLTTTITHGLRPLTLR